MPNLTSPKGSALQFIGATIQFGVGSSPSSMKPVLNLTEINFPLKQRTVEVTNSGDQVVRRRPTLGDAGPISFKGFWQPSDPSFANVVGGIRYCNLNQIKVDFQILYPNADASSDAAQGYFTDFSVDGKVGDVFHYTGELVIDDSAPSLA